MGKLVSFNNQPLFIPCQWNEVPFQSHVNIPPHLSCLDEMKHTLHHLQTGILLDVGWIFSFHTSVQCFPIILPNIKYFICKHVGFWVGYTCIRNIYLACMSWGCEFLFEAKRGCGYFLPSQRGLSFFFHIINHIFPTPSIKRHFLKSGHLGLEEYNQFLEKGSGKVWNFVIEKEWKP